jgi:hypothetical protein
MSAAQMLSTQLLDAAMLNYLRCKFPQLSADELAVQIEETLRFLFIADECTGSIPVSREIDEIWHAWILQTQEYMALCERLPTGRYIHHSSNQYLRYFDATVGEGEDLSESVTMLALYVANFGPFEPQRAPHWLLVRHMTSQWHWPLEAVNDWLCTTPAEPTSICQSVLAKAASAGQDRAHDHALLQPTTQRQPPGDAARP